MSIIKNKKIAVINIKSFLKKKVNITFKFDRWKPVNHTVGNICKRAFFLVSIFVATVDDLAPKASKSFCKNYCAHWHHAGLFFFENAINAKTYTLFFPFRTFRNKG